MENIKNLVIKKLKNKNATIGIIGLGYVGRPLMLRYCKTGYKVFGIDVNVERVYIIEPVNLFFILVFLYSFCNCDNKIKI